jgi:lipopolysaccharide biosynthesis glycosyltransferase
MFCSTHQENLSKAKKNTSSRAWITYANNDFYFEKSLILFQGLEKVGSIYDFLLLVPEDYHPQQKIPLNIRIEKVKPLDQEGESHITPRYSVCINKIYVWLFTQYEKVGWLDSDMIIMKNIDSLFDIDFNENAILAASGCLCNVFQNPRLNTTPEKCPFVNASNVYMNTGLFIVKPDPAIFQELLVQDYNRPFPEQDVFNDVFQNKICFLPSTYNYMSHLEFIHPEIDGTDVSVFHFTYGKPWESDGRPIYQKYYNAWRELS